MTTKITHECNVKAEKYDKYGRKVVESLRKGHVPHVKDRTPDPSIKVDHRKQKPPSYGVVGTSGE
eukprot:CAMPEP_0175065252 /NCGR_PEP_ID=MMETSP0052_2-20121109/15813_1 /TAXON_ID=51329 ORGANISM="Polytomella parva, Strain SAG 63-3" /NCGR_SAMPLE_ID=MMETSP0052_2 /ASSEMBLY_ACC=CAM_ASM_000194 /LENGTH=64 /DNA_ID=CAMNT_0016331749 /DNA_START=539 /DNA_END=733 /DNA_ORIENTATION=-